MENGNSEVVGWKRRSRASERAGKRGIGTSWTFRRARRIQDANVEFSRQEKVLGLGLSWAIPCRAGLSSSLLPSPTPASPRFTPRARTPPSPSYPPVPNWGSVAFGLAPSWLQGCTTSSPTKKFLSHFTVRRPSGQHKQFIRASIFCNTSKRTTTQHTTTPTIIMAGVSDKARFYLERAAPELREFEDKEIFSKVHPQPPPAHPKLTPPPPSPGRNPLPRHQALRPRTHHPLPGRQALRLPRLRRLGALARPPSHQALRAPPHPPVHLARQPRPNLLHL